MKYVKRKGSSTEYQGESFSKSFVKDNGYKWGDNEIATYKLIDNSGNIVVEKALTRSTDKLSMQLLIGKTDSSTLLGKYKLLVYLSDSIETEINYVIAEYNLVYKKAIARIE